MAGNIGSIVDLLLFYTLERVLFNRMVGPMGKPSQLVKKAMALWLTLEEIGYHDLIRTINLYDDRTVEALLEEALCCVECIQAERQEQAAEFDDSSPFFTTLFDEPMNLRFFNYNRDFLFKRFEHIMQTVCDNIFSDNAAVEVDESGTRPVVRPFGEGTRAQDAAIGATSTSRGWAGESSTQSGNEPRQQSTLNPGATEFNPGQTSEDSRTMFLTFSAGHPLTRDEIILFFTSKWGQVVQEVVIEPTHGGKEPLYGRVIFTTSLVIPIILNGQATAKFVVNRKHLWARIYVPRRERIRRH